MPNIRSTLGNLTHTVQDTISSVLNTASTQMENIVGGITTGLTNVWSGGFTGMSEQGMADLKTALETYCTEVQEVIGNFDQQGDITSALKGDIQTAAYDFIAAIKELLQAYVSTMRQEIAEADDAYTNFVAAGKSVASDAQTAAQDIRSNAENIKLD